MRSWATLSEGSLAGVRSRRTAAGRPASPRRFARSPGPGTAAGSACVPIGSRSGASDASRRAAAAASSPGAGAEAAPAVLAAGSASSVRRTAAIFESRWTLVLPALPDLVARLPTRADAAAQLRHRAVTALGHEPRPPVAA